MTIDPQAEAISALAGFLVTECTMEQTMQRLVEVARDGVPTATLAGLTVLDEDGRPATPYYTDELSPHVDHAQYDADRGPCLDAWRKGKVIRIGCLDDAADAYPEFVRTARRAGIESMLAAPVVAGDRAIGALNLYAEGPEAFDETDERAALEIVIPIGAAIANASAYWDAYELTGQLHAALDGRAVIEQAKGVIMATTGCHPDEAFAILREQSQRQNRKLRELAEELVARQFRHNAIEAPAAPIPD